MIEKRLIALDTETTGLYTKDGHRVIEIGCVEFINRRLTGNNFQVFLNPDRESDEEALAVHGITTEFLADKPRFADIAESFLKYIDGAELVIHNAPFDVGFLNYEFSLLPNNRIQINDVADVTDSLAIARDLHPGQRVSLDALCRRYEVANEHRVLHGALLDAEILADVYLAMTGGQVVLSLGDEDKEKGTEENSSVTHKIFPANQFHFATPLSNSEEQAAHDDFLALLRKKQAADEPIPWDLFEPPAVTASSEEEPKE